MIRIIAGSHLNEFAKRFCSVLVNLFVDFLAKVHPVWQRLFNVVGAVCIKDWLGSMMSIHASSCVTNGF